jgi:hypothetical protein
MKHTHNRCINQIDEHIIQIRINALNQNGGIELSKKSNTQKEFITSILSNP